MISSRAPSRASPREIVMISDTDDGNDDQNDKDNDNN